MDKLNRLLTTLPTSQKQAIIHLLDVVLALVCFPLTLLILAPARLAVVGDDWAFVLFLVACAGVMTHLLDLPRTRLKAYEQQAIIRSGILAALLGFVASLTEPFLVQVELPAGSVAVFTMLYLITTVGSRLVLRHLLIEIYRRGQSPRRVLIYGAGQTGVQLATALRTDAEVEPIAFVDDNPTLHKVSVAGLPVRSPVRIEELIEEKRIDRVVLAIPSLSRPKQARIARRLEAAGCEVSTLPSFAALIGEGSLVDRIQPLDMTDYLGRDGLEWDAGHTAIYKNRVVMITGAGGSIGGELTRQVLSCNPKRLVLFEVSELALYQLERELDELPIDTGMTEIVPVLGSVTDEVAVRRALSVYGVDIVLHAAAYKHVPMVERNELAGLHNNTIGSKVLAEAAKDAKVSHFILISTDKAVRPSNVMGASKRLAELVVGDVASRSSDTRFGIVRFGNVLGSSGSVVPLFEEQIARGGPVTLTHTEVTRYFMSLTEAARLVLLAGHYTEGGEVFVLDMGAPVPIWRLARQMIEASGYTVCDADNPDGDIEIQITGLRPGEKLHEELTTGQLPLQKTPHPKILRVEETDLSEIEIAAALKAIARAIETGDKSAVREMIQRWVTDYEPSVPRRRGDGVTGTAGPYFL